MRVRILVLAALLFVGAAPRLGADPIVLTGSGTIGSLNPSDLNGFPQGVHVGDPFTFSLTFDPRPAPQPNPIGLFIDREGNVSITLGNLTVPPQRTSFTGPTLIHVDVLNDPSGSNDLLGVIAFSSAFTLDISGSGGDLLTSSDLPTDISALLNAFAKKQVSLGQGETDDEDRTLTHARAGLAAAARNRDRRGVRGSISPQSRRLEMVVG